MTKENSPKHARISCGLVKYSLLLKRVTMKRLENCRPLTCLFKLVKRIFEVSQKTANTLVQSPEKNRRCHISDTKKPQYNRVHWAELNRSRSGQQNAKNNQVMIEAGNSLLRDHVEMPPSGIVLLKDGHLFLHNSVIERPVGFGG